MRIRKRRGEESEKRFRIFRKSRASFEIQQTKNDIEDIFADDVGRQNIT